jgi:ubiquitin C-terminal hydrolase
MKGFNNLGNTCYLNSGLQMLIQNIDLCNIIITYSNQSLILNKLAKIIIEYHNEHSCSISPNEIKQIIQERQLIFNGFGQQDASEFIICLLNLIDEEIKKINPNSNEIDNLFGINMNVRIKCKYNICLQVSNTKEKNNFLILDINDESKTLDDLYRNFKSSDLLTDDNQYFCENCKMKRIASKRYQVIEWPNNLIIVLKRFKQNGTFITKQNHHINIDLLWRHGMSLISAVIHYGNLNGGHYINISKISDKWYLFNDSNVSLIRSESELNNILNFAYVLNYKKVQ